MRLLSLAVSVLLAACATCSAESAPFPIRVINLDRDTARLATVLAQLEAKGVPRDSIERQPAVLGKSLTDEELRKCTTLLSRMFATRGMIGCYLSHRDFWAHTLAREDSEWVLVLEDDVEVADDFCTRVAAAVEELQACAETRDQWDVLLIGALGCVHPEGRHGLNRINAFVSGGGRKRRRVTEQIHVPRRPFGTHAYALSKRGAAKLLARAPIATMHVDAVAWGLPELQLYCVHPMLAHQAFDDSTIGGTQRGPEALLPHICLDPYTRVTLRWAWNEPVIHLPMTPITLTIGRSLLISAFGFAIAAATGNRAFLAGHTALNLAVFFLLRYLLRPVASVGGGSAAPAIQQHEQAAMQEV